MSERIGKRVFGVFLLGFLALWVGRIVILVPWEQQLPLETRRLFAEGVRLLLWVGLSGWFVRSHAVDWRKFIRLGKPADRVWWSRGFLGTLFYMMVSFVIVRYGFREHLYIVTQRLPLGVYFGLVVTGFAEEFLLRGVVLRAFEQWWQFRWANLLAALFFILIHFPSWLYFYGFNQFQLIQSGLLLIFSLWLGWLTKRSGSIWPGTVGHIFNNYVFGYLIRFVP